MTRAELVKSLKELSIEERYEIFNEISGEGDPQKEFATPEVEAAWNKEIKARMEEYESGAVKAIPWADVKKKMRTR